MRLYLLPSYIKLKYLSLIYDGKNKPHINQKFAKVAFYFKLGLYLCYDFSYFYLFMLLFMPRL